MHHISDNEKELLRRVAAGDEQAFSVFFYAYTDQLYAYILKITKSETWAEELVQDVWAQVWLNRQEMAALDNPVSYLYRMARNRSLDWIRRNKLELKWQYYISIHLVDDRQDTTTERVDYENTRRLFEEAVSKLPPQRKLIFELKHKTSLSYEEIAAKLGISKHTVRNQIVSALQFIREYLRRYGDVLLSLFILTFF